MICLQEVEGFAKSTNRIFHFGSYSYRRQEERRLQEELIRREEELRHKEELFRQQQHELQRHRQEDMMWQVCYFCCRSHLLKTLAFLRRRLPL